MGCSTSKQTLCRNCQASISPTRRGHPSLPKTGDHEHEHPASPLASPALGYLNLDPCNHGRAVVIGPNDAGPTDHDNPSSAGEKFAMGMIEAKTWSNMINHKIPKTPSGEPDIINGRRLKPTRHLRSFSFQVPHKPCLSSLDDDHPAPRVKCIDEDMDADEATSSSSLLDKPASTLDPVDSESNSDDTSIISGFDPELIDTFRKALEELPPASPFILKTMTSDKKQLPREKLIVYFTSLRGVRRTYEDCCEVLVILKELGVRVDERDVSMHSGFKEELRDLSGGIELPMVFIGRKFIGGAEEIRRMDEEGKLKKLVEVCEVLSDDGGKCEACGDTRFLLCEACSGSCKIYYQGSFEEEEHVDEKEVKNGFHRCPDCNENGLIRCLVCCD